MGDFISGTRSRLLLLLATLLVGCADPPARAGPLRLVDDRGDTTVLAAPAERIVSLTPPVTELLFALGAGDRLVGRTTWGTSPPAAVAVPSVGDGLSPNLEAIAARGPDLVVAYASPSTEAAAARLRAAGTPVLQLRLDRLADWERAVHLLGEATGHAAAADSLARAVASAVTAVTREAPDPLRVVLVVGIQPPIVIGAGSFLADIITRAGGRNVFADLPQASAPVSLEAIAARGPDLVLTLGPAPPDGLGRPEWQAVRAVREGRVAAVDGPGWSWPGPRMPEAIAELGDLLARTGP